MLNKLLNEMDGLKEDADILFVLTTNRPEQLEGALANRPGRVDQAIEIPLPDDAGRSKLVQLYGKGLRLDEALIDEAVRRTRGVSAAFIKELMRRTAQAGIGRDGGTTIKSADLGEALDDMLFASGKLNIKLLGGAQRNGAGDSRGVKAASTRESQIEATLLRLGIRRAIRARPSAACRRSAPWARPSSSRRLRAAPRSFRRPSNWRSSPRRLPVVAAGDVVQAVSGLSPDAAVDWAAAAPTLNSRCENRCRDADHFGLRWSRNSLPAGKRSGATMVPGTSPAGVAACAISIWSPIIIATRSGSPSWRARQGKPSSARRYLTLLSKRCAGRKMRSVRSRTIEHYFFLPEPKVGCQPAPFWLGAAAITLIFSFLGFLVSRLPLCSPLAMSISLG